MSIRKLVKVKMVVPMISLLMISSATMANYAVGYQWDWRSDYLANQTSGADDNPAADSEGSTGVWRYAYSAGNDVASRNTDRTDMVLSTDNDLNYIWAQDPSAWNSFANIRYESSEDRYTLGPAPDVSGVAQLGQLVWTAPTSVTVRVYGTIDQFDTSTGNGIIWYLDSNAGGSYNQLATGTLASGAFETIDLEVTVDAGDEIVFSLDANGGQYGDATKYDVTYEIIPEPAVIGIVLSSGGILLFLRRLCMM